MALTVEVKNAEGKKVGSVDLPSEIFDAQTNIPLIHQVVTAQLAAARQGTQKAKNRGETSGSGKKPFKQKGTGRARQGSIRAPLQRGGGAAHAVRPRTYFQRTPKKMIAAATEAKKQLLQLEYSLRTELEKQKLMAMGQMNVNQTQQKEMLDKMKEDRKDERVDKQAVAQSKLISQRKGERPELTDEQEDDIMKILLQE